MNQSEANELKILISAVRHVEKIDGTQSPFSAYMHPDLPACVLAMGVRLNLYKLKDVEDTNTNGPIFARLFGCTKEEEEGVIFNNHTGEETYQAGKELIQKYGLWDDVMSFSDLMASMTPVEV